MLRLALIKRDSVRIGQKRVDGHWLEKLLLMPAFQSLALLFPDRSLAKRGNSGGLLLA